MFSHFPTKMNNSNHQYNHSHCVRDLKTFLDLPESRRGLLPTWWSPSKRGECEAYSVSRMLGKYKYHGHSEGNIFAFTDKQEIMDRYGDNMMPVGLRMLG